jgi:hypothetical protein
MKSQHQLLLQLLRLLLLLLVGASQVANEVLDPFQTFYGNAGELLPRGTVTFFTDSGLGTPLTLLTGASPYTLDDFGRIRGDVTYEGSATLVIANAAGLEIRQLDDVIAANDGDLGEITIVLESVAAMNTDESLAVGTIVRTRGYYAGTRFGGARYAIVAAGTGAADDYLYHQLNNQLQAQLLDLERHKDFLVAGARGDGGSNDTDPMQQVINLGGNITVQNGFTFMATNLTIAAERIRFSGGGAMKQLGASAGDLFQITSTLVREVKFFEVELDGNQVQGNGGNATVGWVLSV